MGSNFYLKEISKPVFPNSESINYWLMLFFVFNIIGLVNLSSQKRKCDLTLGSNIINIKRVINDLNLLRTVSNFLILINPSDKVGELNWNL